MIEAIRRLILLLAFAALTSLTSSPLMAQDSELEFSSTVDAITPWMMARP